MAGSAGRVSLISPAKLNLFLYVTGKRDNGFHELYSLMVPVSLSDRLVIELGGHGIRAVCEHPGVPEDKSNLVCRAAERFMDVCRSRGINLPFEGMRIIIEKNIPVGGGLGGGSSNAASVLTGLNRVAGSPLTGTELEQMGLALGADVPFFISGRPAFATGVGEILQPCGDLPEIWAVIVSPGVFSSTVDVFKKLEFGLTFQPDYIMNTGSNALPFDFGFDGGGELHNDLEDPACKLYPEIGSTKKEMELLLQRKVHMSGSGSSLFALYSGGEAAGAGYRLLSSRFPESGKKVFLARVGQATI
ncbi:MAG: 4-(cytidine 5'-diphospho)-2-C-methyl-D-erythritol kinase [Desulfobacter sp.]|nr:MAG: 4-(cytidine 5'-diphospho)-2-C-methyl-D-erythritol kinase [Desulfobacter sp.]